MPSNPRLLLAALTIALGGCSSTADVASEGAGSTTADLCAGATAANSGDIATTVGCAFENQLFNLSRLGAVSSAPALFDAEGHELASATRSCDVWWQASDANAVTILINGKTGEIRAHGMVHANMPTTTLPPFVPAPITAR
jgi:hypothetical protein